MNLTHTVNSKPDGYRWATSQEIERANHPTYFNQMVRVRLHTDLGDVTDFAIKE